MIRELLTPTIREMGKKIGTFMVFLGLLGTAG